MLLTRQQSIEGQMRLRPTTISSYSVPGEPGAPVMVDVGWPQAEPLKLSEELRIQLAFPPGPGEHRDGPAAHRLLRPHPNLHDHLEQDHGPPARDDFSWALEMEFLVFAGPGADRCEYCSGELFAVATTACRWDTAG